MLFSIIIPVQKINDYVQETCDKLKKIVGSKFEVIIVCDVLPEKLEILENQLGAKIIASGPMGPAGKRDLAAQKSQGKYLAFIDDDAYPDKSWLITAEKYLADGEVAAIGGPQLTPENSSFWQKVSGAMFISPFSGAAMRYWPSDKVREVDDWPTVNFIVKKEHFIKLKGFCTEYWPGEDTKLCLDIIQKLGKKILYVPEMRVYHHRRKDLRSHLGQVGNYALHRGYFAKIFPETSKKLEYFVPTLLVAFLVFGFIAMLIWSELSGSYLVGITFYAAALILSTVFVWIRTRDFLVSLATIPYLILTHVWYGIRFAKGFIFTKSFKSKLR